MFLPPENVTLFHSKLLLYITIVVVVSIVVSITTSRMNSWTDTITSLILLNADVATILTSDQLQADSHWRRV